MDETLKIGDYVRFDSVKFNNFLISEGVLNTSINLTDDLSLLDESLFSIHLQRQYSAAREYNEFIESNEKISECCTTIVDSCIEVYKVTSAQLLPTPAKSHYTFNLRDLSKVFQGMLMTDVNSIGVICCFMAYSLFKIKIYILKFYSRPYPNCSNCGFMRVLACLEIVL